MTELWTRDCCWRISAWRGNGLRNKVLDLTATRWQLHRSLALWRDVGAVGVVAGLDGVLDLWRAMSSSS